MMVLAMKLFYTHVGITLLSCFIGMMVDNNKVGDILLKVSQVLCVTLVFHLLALLWTLI